MRKLSLFLAGALIFPAVAVAQETPQSTPSQDPSATSPDSTTSPASQERQEGQEERSERGQQHRTGARQRHERERDHRADARSERRHDASARAGRTDAAALSGGAPAAASPGPSFCDSVRERIAHQDRVLALGAGRYQGHRAVDQLLDPADIFDRLRRAARPSCARPRSIRASLASSRRPARPPPGPRRSPDNNRASRRAAYSRCRSGSSSNPSSTSSLVSAMPVMPRDRGRLAHQHRVEPAAAALAPGDGAELVAARAEPLADRHCPARSGKGPIRRASYRPWRCPARSRPRSARAPIPPPRCPRRCWTR